MDKQYQALSDRLNSFRSKRVFCGYGNDGEIYIEIPTNLEFLIFVDRSKEQVTPTKQVLFLLLQLFRWILDICQAHRQLLVMELENI